MPELMLLNPRRKHRRRRVHKKVHRRRRHSAVSIMTENPRRRRRHYRMRKNPRRRYRFRRNPTSLGAAMRSGRGVEGFVNSTLIPSAVGALGGVLLDTALAYVPLPASLLTPTMQPFVRIGGAALLAMLADNVAGPRIGHQIGLGAVTVTLYELAASWFAGMGGYVGQPAYGPAQPGPLGYYSQGGLGYYSPAYQMQ